MILAVTSKFDGSTYYRALETRHIFQMAYNMPVGICKKGLQKKMVNGQNVSITQTENRNYIYRLARSKSTHTLTLGVHKWKRNTNYQQRRISGSIDIERKLQRIRGIKFFVRTSSPRYLRKSMFKNQFLLDGCWD